MMTPWFSASQISAIMKVYHMEAKALKANDLLKPDLDFML